MKTGYATFVLFLFLFSGCQQFSATDHSVKHGTSLPDQTLKATENPEPDSLQLQKLFQLNEAERILGEYAYLKDSSFSIGKNAVRYSCAYIAKEKDKKSGKTGAIYFMMEDFVVEDSAKHLYTFFKKANEHSGIETLEKLGDEAYFHTDTVNFLMIIARKESKLLRLKVNKITSHTSLEEFNKITSEIVSGL